MIRVDGKRNIYAEVVADSVSENGDRLTTFKLHYPRLILAELNTHRMFSRNSSSSRAIPVSKMIDQVMDKPAMPVHFGKNQSGMQDAGEHREFIEVPFVNAGGEDDVKLYDAKGYWEKSAESASIFAQKFSDAGYHKQVANRLIEPYQYMNTIVSMTDIDNFFHLRLHKDADPTFVELTECMHTAYETSQPETIRDGDYHLPFIVKKFDQGGTIHYFAGNIEVDLETAIKVSISVCCQVSYRKDDLSIEKALKIYDMLVTMSPIHASPLEHIAKPFDSIEYANRERLNREIENMKLKGINALYCGNFKGWEMYRKSIKGENINNFTGNWD